MIKRILLMIAISYLSFSLLAQDKVIEFYQTKTYGDLILRNTARGKGGRAIVPWEGNALWLNCYNDFTGGTLIGTTSIFNSLSSLYQFELRGKMIANGVDVNGTIRAKEVKIESTGWADFVFKPEYKLPTLSEVENHILEHGHLPSIPSAKEVQEKGVDVGQMQTKLLQKIEELTLYIISLEKRIVELENE